MEAEVFGNNMFGIIQGRLTNSRGKLQCFPTENWEKEFYIARDIGLDYIELISDPEPNRRNPLWSGDIELPVKTVKESGTIAYSLTVDHIMYAPLTSENEAIAQESKEHLLSILENASHIGVKVAVLPFLEGASLKNGLLDKGIGIIKEISNNTGLKIAIESDLSTEDQVRICESANVGICYDTGNRAYFGFVPQDEIPILKSNIIHVHIKDKAFDSKNVMLGAGLVDFSKVSRALNDSGYSGGYTLETSRGEEEVEAARKNLDFLKAFF